MQSYNYDPPMGENYFNDKRRVNETQTYQQNSAVNQEILQLSKSQLAHLKESPAAKARRLARNAERMREKRSRESYTEYTKRLQKNALNNRLKRRNESDTEKALRQVRDAARQRLRRAMETPEQRAFRLEKLAERMRAVRRNESPEKKAERLRKAAEAARERLLRETSEERQVRLQKSSQYARRIRSSKSQSNSLSESDSTSDISYHKPIVRSVEILSCNMTFNQSCDVGNEFNNEPHQYSFAQQHQPVITIPSCKTEKFMNTVPRLRQFPPNVQITIPLNYLNSNFSTVPASNTVSLTINDQSNINYIIQPTHHSAATTLNIPTYTMTSSVIKCEPLTDIAGMIESRSRGRPRKDKSLKMEFDFKIPKPRSDETEEERFERLRLTAEKSRLRRSRESLEQREKRLQDLKDRARRRRELVKMHESEEERKARLAKQAEYARRRRTTLNTVEEKQNIDKKARELYAKIHENSHDKPTVLKILEPIIEMNSSR